MKNTVLIASGYEWDTINGASVLSKRITPEHKIVCWGNDGDSHRGMYFHNVNENTFGETYSFL